MNSNEHIRLLQQVHRNIDGIKYAPDDTPEHISSTPAVIIRSDGMGANVIGAREACIKAEFSYQVFLLSGKAGDNTFGAKASRAYDLADDMLSEYHKASVNGLPGIDATAFPRLVLDTDEVISHGGLITFDFNENNVFTAIQFTLIIEDMREFPV